MFAVSWLVGVLSERAAEVMRGRSRKKGGRIQTVKMNELGIKNIWSGENAKSLCDRMSLLKLVTNHYGKCLCQS